MKLANSLRISWVRFVEGSEPQFHEEPFHGTLQEGTAELRSRADRHEFDFAQLLEADGRVLCNVAPRLPAAAHA